MTDQKYIFYGTIIDTPDPLTLRIRKQHVCVVNNGKIEMIEASASPNLDKYQDYVFIKLSESQFICPGFVDLHCHAPQYRQVGSATEVPLLKWLYEFTFPNEARCSDPLYARDLYTKLVSRLLRNGTTTAQYFATIHLEATKILAEICQEKGQRAYIGKVCADQNSPDFYIETTDESVRNTEEFINYVHHMQKGRDIVGTNALIHPVITPRFIPTCSINLLSQLGQLTKKYDVHVQSHIAETADQVTFVHCLYPNIGNGRDVAIFRETGLLTNKAVFAHGIYLADNEVDEMVTSGSAVASCPIANFLFSKGITTIEHLRRKGLKVGLGTDVGGAYSSNMLPVVRAAVFGNRTMDFVSFDRSTATLPVFPDHKDPVIDFKFAFYLATLGGAQALNIDSQIGSFEVGKQFDALLIDCNKENQAFDYWKEDQIDIIFEKWVNAGDDRNIIAVWVQGGKQSCI
jgi:guanine deaminase